MTYSEKLKDPHWQKKRLDIMQRDNFTCRVCGDKKKTLHVHHVKYYKYTEPWEINNEYLFTLCEKCHNNVHAIENERHTLASQIIDKTGMSEFELLIRAYKIIEEYNNGA